MFNPAPGTASVQPPAPRAPAPARNAPAAAQPDTAEDASVIEPTEARAVDLVDLNSGSLTELNGLKGGGSIGRAIIQRRPYTSTDQLLSKRVLSRTTYLRIKDQVTVR